MQKKKSNVNLPESEIRAILRAADDIIAQGGRTLLARILKGSKEKKLLELGLDQNPSYGFFHLLSLDEVIAKIDWMIQYDFLKIEFSGKLPMVVFTEKGWEIERGQYADELLLQWDHWLAEGKADVDMNYLKDRNRGMILLFLQHIQTSCNKGYIPYLQAWEKIDDKKMKQAIREVIGHLESGNEIVSSLVMEGNEKQDAARHFEIRPIESEVLKCWECGYRFVFEADEQKFFKLKGFHPPKRCPACREKKWFREMESISKANDADTFHYIMALRRRIGWIQTAYGLK